MPSDWKECTLGDAITLQRGFDLPIQDRKSGSVPVVSSSGITGTHSEAKVSGPGVVTGRYGTIGKVFYIEQDLWPLNTTLYVKDFKGNDPLFISYLLHTVDFESCSDKSSVPGINRNHLHMVRVRVPPLSEQRSIAYILGTLDDKIELNHQINKTLESIAQALFRSWFVDFDPVRAKMEGHQPYGIDAETAAFFPDSFEDSVLGEIPKGWSTIQLNKIADFIKGVSYKSEYLRESQIALVTLKSIGRGGGYKEEGLKPYIGEFKSKQRLLSGEVVVAHTDLTQAAEVLGRVARIRYNPNFHTLIASLDLVIVRPIGACVSNEFLYDLLSRDEFQEHAYRYANGTTVLHLSTKALPEYLFVLPPSTLIETFTRLVLPIYQLIDQNVESTFTLTAIRDALLPKLLLGEIRVKDAEKFVEANA